jgi:hypothetical protein
MTTSKRIIEQKSTLEQLQIDINNQDIKHWVIDFDQTLYSGNSTEDFLSQSRPAIIIAPLIVIFRKIIPRLFRSKDISRRQLDHLLIMAVCVLTPWSLARWRKSASTLARGNFSHPLALALSKIPTTNITIVSFGFREIILPLIENTSWSSSQLISQKIIQGTKTTRLTKTDLIAIKQPALDIKNSAIITDSMDDEDLLLQSNYPYLIAATGPKKSPLSYLYIPLKYTFGTKFTIRHALDQIVFVDLIIALIAFNGLYSLDIKSIAAYTSLFIAIFTVYEIGYYENDTVGIKYEKNKKTNFNNKTVNLIENFELYAWLWAAFFSACYIALSKSSLNFAFLSTCVVALLALIRSIYFVYNRSNESTRVKIYPFLQASKSIGITLINTTNLPGLALTIAQSFMMSCKYIAYRSGGDMQNFNKETTRLTFYALLLIAFLPAIIDNTSLEQTAALIAASSWIIWRAMKGRIKSFIRR